MKVRRLPPKSKSLAAPAADVRALAPAQARPRVRVATALRVALIGVVASFAFLPIGSWLSVDVGAPAVETLLSTWAFGLALTAPVAFLMALLARRIPKDNWLERIRSVSDQHWLLSCAALAAASCILNALIAHLVFGGFALHIDELTQAIQARTFASGRIWQPSQPDPEFVSALLMVDHNGRTFAQFPPGWAALLAAGEVLGVRWLVGPVVGAVATLGLVALLRALGESRLLALFGAALFAVSPWVVFNAATQMNHTAALTCLLVGSAALLYGLRAATNARLSLALAGFAFGVAATIRPLEAFVFGLPAAAWLLWRALQRRRAREIVAFALGAVPPVALLLTYNALTTGAPFVFGYEVLWDKTHGLGFHDAPWGPPHTLARGLALLNKYFLRMQQVLLDAPVPALLGPLVALALARKISAGERYLLVCAALLCAGYFLYWHDGEYLGPRFLLPLAALAFIWTARLPRVLAERTRATFAHPWASSWILLVVLVGMVGATRTARDYAASYPERRVDVNTLARNVSHAVIFVPSPWGAQLTPRLWALGIPRRAAQALYDQIDSCALESALTAVERTGTRGQAALARIRAYAMGVSSQDATSPDARERRAPSSNSALCSARVQAERAGTWSLLPFLAARHSGNVFVRDLHERNALLFRRFRGPFYVLRPDSVLGLRRPRLLPMNVDSAQWEWTVLRVDDANPF
jgi:hypothetical protein